MPSNNSEDWKKIAEQLTKETDTRKLIELAEKLNAALEHGAKPVRPTPSDDRETEVA